jgi:hypothetical protein
VSMPMMQPSFHSKKPNPYGEGTRESPERTVSYSLPLSVIISAECEDLLCPFLKSTPIALRRVHIDQDTIEVNQNSGS